MARRSSDADAIGALIALFVLVIGFVIWITPYILQALAFIFGALASFCIKYKKEIWRCSWELMAIGLAYLVAFGACTTHEGGRYYELYLIILSATNWFTYRSIALQFERDSKNKNLSIKDEKVITIEKVNVIKVEMPKEKPEVKNVTKQLQQMKTDYPINIEKCKKEDIMTLAGFDEKKAQQVINARKNGKMWYSIEDFCQDYNPKPHELIYIENRLVFPPKPNLKKGRTVDV